MVGVIAMYPVFRNPSFSLTQVSQPAIFSFLQFYIPAEPTLVELGVSGGWLL